MYSPAKLAESGTAEFQNHEEVRIHNDSSENITPSGEFYENKKNEEINVRTQEALGIAAGKDFKEYVDNGITEIEQYLRQNIPQVQKVGVLIEAFRTDKLQ